MTHEQLTHLRRLLAEATPGPWTHNRQRASDDSHDIIHPQQPEGVVVATCGRQSCDDGIIAANARLIAAAVNALPELLDAAEREAKLREALSKVLVGVCPASVQQQRLADNLEALCHEVYDISRAALAEGGAK